MVRNVWLSSPMGRDDNGDFIKVHIFNDGKMGEKELDALIEFLTLTKSILCPPKDTDSLRPDQNNENKGVLF